MKLNTTTLVLGLSLAVVAGLFASVSVFGTGLANKENTASTASAFISGHVTTIQKDAEGNVVAYRQTDNQIVNQGENCAARLLFQPVTASGTGTTVCTGALSTGFVFIQIGNSTATNAPDQYKLANPHNSTSFGSTTTLAIAQSTSNTWTNNTSTTATNAASVILSKTFTNNSGRTVTVSESGLFNSTDNNSNAMFARQQFTTITLSNNDQLTVQWTVNVGGTASIS